MKVISEVTWMNAAKAGWSRPDAAIAMPMRSTMMVPAKFCQMTYRVHRAIRTVSANLSKSLPSSTTSEVSRATSVPEPIATPT